MTHPRAKPTVCGIKSGGQFVSERRAADRIVTGFYSLSSSGLASTLFPLAVIPNSGSFELFEHLHHLRRLPSRRWIITQCVRSLGQAYPQKTHLYFRPLPVEFGISFRRSTSVVKFMLPVCSGNPHIDDVATLIVRLCSVCECPQVSNQLLLATRYSGHPSLVPPVKIAPSEFLRYE